MSSMPLRFSCLGLSGGNGHPLSGGGSPAPKVGLRGPKGVHFTRWPGAHLEELVAYSVG